MRDKIDCAVFDLDGTLADVRHRLPLIKCDKPNWPAFFAACVHDTPISYVVKLNHMVASKMPVLICSGRPETWRKESTAWLNYNKVVFTDFYMRAEKDYRPDHITKKEMLDEIRSLNFNPVFAVDDRPTVVQMWRENNVPCFAVDDTEWRNE